MWSAIACSISKADHKANRANPHHHRSPNHLSKPSLQTTIPSPSHTNQLINDKHIQVPDRQNGSRLSNPRPQERHPTSPKITNPTLAAAPKQPNQQNPPAPNPPPNHPPPLPDQHLKRIIPIHAIRPRKFRLRNARRTCPPPNNPQQCPIPPQKPFILTLSQRYNPTQPLSTPLYTLPSSLDFATRMAKVLARKTGRAAYVGSSVSFADGVMGGNVEEEMEGFRRVVEAVMGVVEAERGSG